MRFPDILVSLKWRVITILKNILAVKTYRISEMSMIIGGFFRSFCLMLMSGAKEFDMPTCIYIFVYYWLSRQIVIDIINGKLTDWLYDLPNSYKYLTSKVYSRAFEGQVKLLLWRIVKIIFWAIDFLIVSTQRWVSNCIWILKLSN